MFVLVAFCLSFAAGIGLPDLIRTGHKVTAVTIAGALTAATATEEWQVILVGAILGAVIGTLVDVVQSPWQRLRMFIASVSASIVATIPITDKLGWPHDQATLLFVAAGAAFVAWPLLRQLRKVDWPEFIARKLRVPPGDPK